MVELYRGLASKRAFLPFLEKRSFLEKSSAKTRRAFWEKAQQKPDELFRKSSAKTRFFKFFAEPSGF
jgi:hypothetical protein